jgi:hypothetical protein
MMRSVSMSLPSTLIALAVILVRLKSCMAFSLSLSC